MEDELCEETLMMTLALFGQCCLGLHINLHILVYTYKDSYNIYIYSIYVPMYVWILVSRRSSQHSRGEQKRWRGQIKGGGGISTSTSTSHQYPF